MLLARLILGHPLANREYNERKIGAFEGVPAMGLDGLGSSSYGPEAALTILIPLGAALGQSLVDLACAHVHFLPLSEKDGQRFGITKEWCTPEVSAALRAKLRLDEPNNLGLALAALGEQESGTKRLEEAVEAYRAALQERTRERVPLQWAMTQNNLGLALAALGEQESGTKRLEEAVEAYRAALQERTCERVPLQWARTQTNLGIALARLGERDSSTKRLKAAVASFSSVLQVEPDNERAYSELSNFYRDKLFAFAENFNLNQAWLERHPDDLGAQASFADAAFTASRFAEAEQRLEALAERPELKLKPLRGIVVAIRALEICSLVALDRLDTLKAKLDALGDLLKGDGDELVVPGLTFAGSRHFIGGHPELSRHPWLIRLLAAIEEGNAADARSAVAVGQAATAAAQ